MTDNERDEWRAFSQQFFPQPREVDPTATEAEQTRQFLHILHNDPDNQE